MLEPVLPRPLRGFFDHSAVNHLAFDDPGGLLIADGGMRLWVVPRAPATPERQQGWQTKPMYGRHPHPKNHCTLIHTFKEGFKAA